MTQFLRMDKLISLWNVYFRKKKEKHHGEFLDNQLTEKEIDGKTKEMIERWKEVTAKRKLALNMLSKDELAELIDGSTIEGFEWRSGSIESLYIKVNG